MDEFKAAVEISREWDGEKVASEIVKKFKDKDLNPKFILLFTTIHYEKEFKKILNGIKDAFPDTPLIGGTVAGFITNEGSYTRGVTVATIDCLNMDVSVSAGKGTKKNPGKAVEEFLGVKKEKKYENQLIFDIISGSIIPELPKMGRTNVSFSKSKSKIFSSLLPIAGKFGTGLGKEEEIIKLISEKRPESFIFGLSSMDNGKMINNFQFLNEKVLTNSIVGMTIQSDLSYNISFSHGLNLTERKFIITDISEDNRIIKKLDGKPAVERFMEVMGWSKELIGDLDKFYRTTFFYPFGFKKDNVICPCNIGGFLGNTIPLGYSIEGKELTVLSGTGKSLIDAARKILKDADDSKKFNVFANCGATLEALGDKVFEIQDILSEKFDQFLVVYGSGENFYKPHENSYHLNESIVMLQI